MIYHKTCREAEKHKKACRLTLKCHLLNSTKATKWSYLLKAGHCWSYHRVFFPLGWKTKVAGVAGRVGRGSTGQDIPAQWLDTPAHSSTHQHDPSQPHSSPTIPSQLECAPVKSTWFHAHLSTIWYATKIHTYIGTYKCCPQCMTMVR